MLSFPPLEWWLTSQWSVWGIFPVLAFVLGYLLTAAPLELLLLHRSAQDKMLSYKKDSSKHRVAMIAETRSRVPVREQLGPIAKLLFGPGAIANGEC